jgi:GR25 family glycosyltransferase involved in LPS biosynthesis
MTTTVPFVSVLCATFNRQHLIPYIIHQFNVQTYPKLKMELIIYDDSDYQCYYQSNDKRITYIYDNQKQNIGFKRNFLNAQAKGDIIIWQDDDDYYFQDRIQKSVDAFTNNNASLIGVKSTKLYDAISQTSVEVKHSTPNYTQNNIMAYKKDFLETHSYLNSDKCNEERHFTSNYSEPLYAFDGKELCIHIAHRSNTAAKAKALKKYTAQKFDIGNVIKDEYALKIIKSLSSKHKFTFHWINLKKDTERRGFMESQFDFFQMENVRFEALKPDEIKYNAPKIVLNKTRPEEFACMCSHLKLLRDILKNSNDEIFFILEDDIQLKTQITNLRAIIDNAPSDWDILQLHHVCFRDTNIPKKNWMRWDRTRFCTTFYAIKRDCAQRLISKYMTESTDDATFNFMRCNENVQADKYIFLQSKTYTLMKPIATTNLKFDTNIQLTSSWQQKKTMIQQAEEKKERLIQQAERNEELKMNLLKNKTSC